MSSDLARALDLVRDDPVNFNNLILGRVHDSLPEGYWSKQREVLESVGRFRKTVVQSANSTGKTHLASGAALHFLYTRARSKVLIFAPSFPQLSTVLWAKVASAWHANKVGLPGRLYASPLKLQVSDEWLALAFSADSAPEKLSGHHCEHLLVICDEASAKEYDRIWDSLDGLNASRYLFIGNPIRAGRFRDLCHSADGATINKIQISAFDSPHIGMDRSPVGLADKSFIEDFRLQYGESSPHWKARVLGEFPDDDDLFLVPNRWLDLCRDAQHVPTGITRIGIDVASGRGADKTVVCVLDDGGLWHLEGSSGWSWDQSAAKVRELADQYGVEHHRIRFDEGGIGLGYAYALGRVGIEGARPVLGGEKPSNKKYYNKRSESAWNLRQRLDPDRFLGFEEHDQGDGETKRVPIRQKPFAIRTDHLELLRKELTAVKIDLESQLVKIENKDDLKGRLKSSPDFGDALMIAFQPVKEVMVY